MAAGTQVPVEIYLRSYHYSPDAEYLDGQIRERPVGDDFHSAWQEAICAWFREHAEAWNIRVRPELRVRVSPTRYLIPDVSILDATYPRERIATKPPLAAFEVLSPDNTMREMMAKFEDYRQMGIPQIWLIDSDSPGPHVWQRYEDGRLVNRNVFDLSSRGIHFDMDEITRRVR
jgi:Uma2 family endonuclease